MSDRHLKILAGILVFFVLAWAVARVVSGRGGGGEAAPFKLTSLEGLELDSLVVAGPRDTLRLLHGNGWTVNGHEATADAGEALESALKEAKLGPLVSRNPENHARLGVDADSGRVLGIYSGGEERMSLILGKQAQLPDRAYVRLPDADDVYTLQGTLVGLARRKVDDWRNRQILDAVRGDIQRIEYAYGDTAFSLVRDSAAWRLEPAGASVAENAVAPILSNLSQLRAVGFAADSVADTLSFESPTARVKLLGPERAAIGELAFIEREENVGYYVRRSGSPVVYTLSAFSGKQILKRTVDLVPNGDNGR